MGGGVVPRHRVDDVRPHAADRRPHRHPSLRGGGPGRSGRPERRGRRRPLQGRSQNAAPTTAPDARNPTTPDARLPAPTVRGSGGLAVRGAGVVLCRARALVPTALRPRLRGGGGWRRWARADADAPSAAWAELLAESEDRGVMCPPTDTVRGGARRPVREHQLDQECPAGAREVVQRGGGELVRRGPGPPTDLAAVRCRPCSPASRGAGSRSLRERLMPRSVTLRRSRAHGRRPGQGLEQQAPRAVVQAACHPAASDVARVRATPFSSARTGSPDARITQKPPGRGPGGRPDGDAIPARTGGGNAPPSGR